MPNNQNKNTTLQAGVFEVFSDIHEPQIQFFLSYTGNQFNHCGIRIRATWLISAEDIHQIIKISNSKNSDVGQIVTGEMGQKILIAPISTNPNMQTHGEFFTISTRDGQSLSSVFAKLSNLYSVSAIVETMGCQ